MRKYRRYDKESFNIAVSKVESVAGLLRELGLKGAGGNYAHACRNLQKFKSNTDHWTGQAWNKGKQLKNWLEYNKVSSFKPILIRERGHKCENKQCGLMEWYGKLINLEVHHIDGDRTNNEKKNLQLLCPNCHSHAPNFRNRKS
jgi:hypothetical protein